MLSACLLQLQNGQCLFRVLGNGVHFLEFLTQVFFVSRKDSRFIAAAQRQSAITVEFDFVDPTHQAGSNRRALLSSAPQSQEGEQQRLKECFTVRT